MEEGEEGGRREEGGVGVVGFGRCCRSGGQAGVVDGGWGRYHPVGGGGRRGRGE